MICDLTTARIIVDRGTQYKIKTHFIAHCVTDPDEINTINYITDKFYVL